MQSEPMDKRRVMSAESNSFALMFTPVFSVLHRGEHFRFLLYDKIYLVFWTMAMRKHCKNYLFIC